MIGIGMMYDPHMLEDEDSASKFLPSIIRSKKAVAQIRALLQEKAAVIAVDYGHNVYRCTKCGEFYGRFFIHLDYDGGSYEVDYKCTKCRTSLELVGNDAGHRMGEVAIDLQKYPCPQCGKHSLYEDTESMILWD